MIFEFLILVEQTDLIPIERQVATDGLGVAVRLLVSPDRVLGDTIADLHAPVARVALEWAVRGVLGPVEEVHAHILGREVIRGRQPGLVQHERARGIGNTRAVELDADTLLAWLEADLVVPGHGALSYHRCVTLLP